MKIGLHTRLRPGVAARYDELHRAVPRELVDAIRAAGFTEWHIFRQGEDLFHCIEVDDYEAAIAAIADLPVNVEWQATITELMADADDYNDALRSHLELVWDLSW